MVKLELCVAISLEIWILRQSFHPGIYDYLVLGFITFLWNVTQSWIVFIFYDCVKSGFISKYCFHPNSIVD